MKKLSILLLMTIGFILAGCEVRERNANVRFQNVMSDQFSFSYGLKFGEAVYEGQLAYGVTTQYYETSSGNHTLEAKSVYGSWLTLSSATFMVEGGKNYTISILGTAQTAYFQLAED